jgi:hypothetical protein
MPAVHAVASTSDTVIFDPSFQIFCIRSAARLWRLVLHFCFNVGGWRVLDVGWCGVRLANKVSIELVMQLGQFTPNLDSTSGSMIFVICYPRICFFYVVSFSIL